MKKREPSPTELAVTAWLEKAGIKYEVYGGHATKLGDWPCDAWTWIMSRRKVGTQDQLRMEDKLHTGIGQRQLTPIGQRYMSSIRTSDTPNRVSNARRQIIAEHSRAVAPKSASVIYCLLSDADGAEQNFHDWCSDFGGDNDSISSLNTYNACCEVLNKVRAFFTQAERAELRELLEDY